MDEEERICMIPESCDTDGDGVVDLRAGESVRSAFGSTKGFFPWLFDQVIKLTEVKSTP
jgi:hypothetical protein